MTQQKKENNNNKKTTTRSFLCQANWCSLILLLKVAFQVFYQLSPLNVQARSPELIQMFLFLAKRLTKMTNCGLSAPRKETSVWDKARCCNRQGSERFLALHVPGEEGKKEFNQHFPTIFPCACFYRKALAFFFSGAFVHTGFIAQPGQICFSFLHRLAGNRPSLS